MTCKTLGFPKKKICSGDLNKRITIQSRSLGKGDFTEVEITETFTDIANVWAAFETVSGFKAFNSVGTNQQGPDQTVGTHRFYVRFQPSTSSVTSENWVEFKSQKYKAITVENLDENDEFIAITCIKKGPKTLDANLA